MTQLMRFVVALASLSGAALSAQDSSVSMQPEVPIGRRTLAGRRIGAEQLEQMLAASNREPDEELAKQLSELELTERLSAARLARSEANLPGPDARRALRALADRSSFFDPPASEIPTIAEPDPEAQSKMIALTEEYVNKVIHQLPNLYATRVATSFAEDLRDRKPLHWVSTEMAIVRYRDSQEMSASREFHAGSVMTTQGEFGPILFTALHDSAQGLTWSHWEQGAEAPEAVYRYTVNAGKSHFKVDGQFPGYHGEITVDPLSGAVLRLVVRAVPDPSNHSVELTLRLNTALSSLGGRPASAHCGVLLFLRSQNDGG